MGVVTQESGRKLSWARHGPDRRRDDRRNVFAGIQYRKTASLQKIIALATGSDPSWVSRQCKGDTTGAVQRFYAIVDALTRHPKADASPIIAGSLVVQRRALGDLPRADLTARLLGAVMEAETRADTDEDRAEAALMPAWGTDAFPGALRAWRDALVAAIERQLSAVVLIDAVLDGEEQ